MNILLCMTYNSVIFCQQCIFFRPHIGFPIFPNKSLTVGYDSTSFCNMLTTGQHCAWTLLGNTLLWRMYTESSVCSQFCCVCVWKRPWGFNLCTILFITTGGHSQICMYVCVYIYVVLHACVHVHVPACVCTSMCQILRIHVLFITFLVCIEKQAGKPKPNRAVHSLLSTALSQTENWEGWGPNYTWWEKRTLRLFPALCVQHVYSDRVCVAECNGCVVYVFLWLGPLWARAVSLWRTL